MLGHPQLLDNRALKADSPGRVTSVGRQEALGQRDKDKAAEGGDGCGTEPISAAQEGDAAEKGSFRCCCCFSLAAV